MTKRLRPFFSYFGSKYTLAPRYPAPIIGHQIIEPFAGSAGYSTYYPHYEVILCDISEVICGVWEYLINVSEQELLSLPMLSPGEDIPHTLIDEARAFIGFWCQKANTNPAQRKRNTNWNANKPMCDWSEQIRARTARQLQYIRHWKVQCTSYDLIDTTCATYFVDPPYQSQGHRYANNFNDHQKLYNWCKNLNGQVIVCENTDADWLNNATIIGTSNGVLRKTTEVFELIQNYH